MSEYMFIYGPIGIKTDKFIGVKADGNKLTIKGDKQRVDALKRFLERSLGLAQSFKDKNTIDFQRYAFGNKYVDIETFEPEENDKASKKFESMDGTTSVLVIQRVPTPDDADFDKELIKEFIERRRKMNKNG